MSKPAPAKESGKAKSRETGRVLLITDHIATAEYGAILENAGFEVVGVTGSAAALISLPRTRPHVVVADTKLRRIRAEELARTITQGPDSVPILLIGSEQATLEQRCAAVAAGAYDYIQMPDESRLLEARTRQLVA
jgi:DNA-binding NtrC family response regulator